MDVTLSSPFDPNRLYTARQVAEILDRDTEWVKKHLIYPRKCRHKREGSVYLFYGAWIIEWVLSDHEQLDDSNE